MKLITNKIRHNHLKSIKKLIEKSSRMVLCTAWINPEGIKKILPSLKQSIVNNHAKIEIYSNKKHTNIQSEQLLLNNHINHHIIDSKYLHTKVYLFEYKKRFTALIGSANLTKGALVSNEELSVKIKGKINSKKYIKLLRYIENLKSLI